jgi:hypothetical protein
VTSESEPPRPKFGRLDLYLCALLAISTAAVYARAAALSFVGYDDPLYVASNPVVLRGLTLDGVGWAFSTYHAANWHPLTWLSHMLDVELWGVWAGGHHLTSVALHVTNTLLLFALLRTFTAERWRSAVVAALFALHPLHVESVVWVSERKDVLSSCFALVSLFAYGHWARRGGAHRYAGALAAFALSLLAKPTWVTLPILLLLFDVWPLARLRLSVATRPTDRLLAEKLPFAALSLVSCVVTLAAQRSGGALWASAEVALVDRLANALVSLWCYLGKTLWPVDLSVLYSHPYIPETGGTPWLVWQLVAAAAAFVVVSAVIFWLRSRTHLVFGWLWYLVALVPVIGIVQVGAQGMADRYAYVPLIGIFVAVVWGIGDELRRHAAPGAAVVLSLCSILLFSFFSWRQVGVWRDSVSLFEHALARTPGNWIAHAHLGDAYLEAPLPARTDVEVAVRHYERVIAIRPDHQSARASLATLLVQLGRTAQAEAHLKEVARRRAASSSVDRGVREPAEFPR